MITDNFKGDDVALLSSIESLLNLDAAGALVPHGIGGHARDLLSAAHCRLKASAETDVRKIMLDVVPGDGMGYEVYAKTNQDVIDRLSKVDAELEDWQLGIKRLPRTAREVFDLLVATMEADNGSKYRTTSEQFEMAEVPICELLNKGYFKDSPEDLEGSFWMCIGGDQEDAEKFFERAVEAYRLLYIVMSHVFNGQPLDADVPVIEISYLLRDVVNQEGMVSPTMPDYAEKVAMWLANIDDQVKPADEIACGTNTCLPEDKHVAGCHLATSVKGWLAALADAYHCQALDAHTRGKLKEVLTHLAAAPSAVVSEYLAKTDNDLLTNEEGGVEADGYAIEAAYQAGFQTINDNADVFCASARQIAALVRSYRQRAESLSHLEVLSKALEEMIGMLEEREWAEHVSTIHKHPLAVRLEAVITDMHNEIGNSEVGRALLDEVKKCFTRDDDLPNDLLPRIDAYLKEGNDDDEATPA